MTVEFRERDILSKIYGFVINWKYVKFISNQRRKKIAGINSIIPQNNLMKNIKPQPNRQLYIQVLKKMSAEQRLLKTFELSDMVKTLFRENLRLRFPDLNEQEFHAEYLKRLEKCHNKNY